MKTHSPFKNYFLASFLILIMMQSQAQQPTYQSPAYRIFSNKVVQAKMEATVLSNSEIVSNYKSPTNQFKSTQIAFKFSINGKDNEMLSGVNHQFNLLPGASETPLIKFGELIKDQSGNTNTYLQLDTKLKNQGGYECYS